MDVTDRKRLEAQCLQAQKLEAIGRMAGGIAHDFNNLLTIITGYSDVLLQVLAETDPNRETVAVIRDAGERATRITQQLLAFSRKSVVEPKVLDLNDAVLGAAGMLRRLLGADVELATICDPTLGRIRIDPGQVEQVLVNLAVNARDAMPRGGRVTLESRAVTVGGDRGRADYPDLEPGCYALFAVTDTGCGMTEEVKARLFEPFFTTKEVGKGTGLGLAVVHGIVRQGGRPLTRRRWQTPLHPRNPRRCDGARMRDPTAGSPGSIDNMPPATLTAPTAR